MAAVTISLLIVDDDVALLRAMTRVLKGPGLDIVTASDANSALALMQTRPVDIILSDIDMPGMSGLALLSIVRREHPSTIRMLITGDATTERALAAINEGEVARFFVKPFALEELRATIVSFGDRIHRVRQEAEQRRERARIAALTSWAERKFPGSTEVARDETGAIVVDRAAYDVVFTPRRA